MLLFPYCHCPSISATIFNLDVNFVKLYNESTCLYFLLHQLFNWKNLHVLHQKHGSPNPYFLCLTSVFWVNMPRMAVSYPYFFQDWVITSPPPTLESLAGIQVPEQFSQIRAKIHPYQSRHPERHGYTSTREGTQLWTGYCIEIHNCRCMCLPWMHPCWWHPVQGVPRNHRILCSAQQSFHTHWAEVQVVDKLSFSYENFETETKQ